MHTTSSLQSSFLSYFNTHTHTIVPSSSVCPTNDPTLLFTNSGMVQFKELFSLNNIEITKYHRRATSSQCCIRAGGKHNELDDVGKDSYHHTFFFMLGNWSFGDYWKEEAIFYAWDYLTNVLGLDKDRLYVSYYKSSTEGDLNFTDEETRRVWLKYLPEDRVLPFDAKDNFWEMGDTGPCGPCTEIHYDARLDRTTSGSTLVNMDDPDVIEIWNVVFIEYYRSVDGGLTELSMKSIDTGMGLERVLRILNGVGSNYMTDSFTGKIQKIENKVLQMNSKLDSKLNSNENGISEFLKLNRNENGSNELNSKLNSNENGINELNGNENGINELNSKLVNDLNINELDTECINNSNTNTQSTNLLKLYTDCYDQSSPNFHTGMCMRVIADHSRTIAICLHFGIRFSAEGRGYVLRRIIRRAIRYCKELGLESVMGMFVKRAGEVLPISVNICEEMVGIVEDEERLFLRTLEKGKKIFYKTVKDIKNSNESCVFPGRDAFILYDTFGFPLDLTEIMCGEENMVIDKEGFEKCKAEGKERSKKKEVAECMIDYRGIDKLKIYKPTNDSYKYTTNGIESKVICILKGNDIIKTLLDNSDDSHELNDLDEESIYSVLCEKNCFYSESGGQVGDSAVIRISGAEFMVTDTQKYNDYVLHFGKFGNIKEMKNMDCLLVYDEERRNNIKNNHTATHILNHALRTFFTGIEQKGSLVDDKKLRFDFSYGKNMGIEEIKRIEDYMNKIVNDKIEVSARLRKFSEISNKDESMNSGSIKDKKINYDSKKSSNYDNNEENVIRNGTERNIRDDKNYTDNINEVKHKKSVREMVQEINLNTKQNNCAIEDVIYLKDEKYPDTVRVIDIKGISKELCGGTHVKNTAHIIKIRIVSEGSISSNTRRIVAVTGSEAKRIEDNVGLENALDLEIPLYERNLLSEKIRKLDKERIAERKKTVNMIIESMKYDLKSGFSDSKLVEKLGIGNKTLGFVFECKLDGGEEKNIAKELNSVGSVLDKEKMDGVVYYIKNNVICFSVRGKNSLERARKLGTYLKDSNVGGTEKCANGKGMISE